MAEEGNLQNENNVLENKDTENSNNQTFYDNSNEDKFDLEEEEKRKPNIIEAIKNLPQDRNKLIIIIALAILLIGSLFYYFSTWNSEDDPHNNRSTNAGSNNNYDSNMGMGTVVDLDKDDSQSSSEAINKDDSTKFAIADPQKPLAVPEIPPPPPLPTPIAPSNPDTIEIPKPQPKIEKSLEINEKTPEISLDNAESAPTIDIKPIESIPIISETKEEKENRLNKMRSSIMVFGSAMGGDAIDGGIIGEKFKKNGENAKDSSSPDKKFLGFDNGSIDNVDALATSSSEAVTATQVRNLNRTIIQGKIIDAVLETAITTQIEQPGVVRAVITRDIYAEQGRNILIPKGSRAIGKYDSSAEDGQTRVNVIWDRIVTDKGIDIKIASQGGDRLGRVGLPGFSDDKFASKLMSAFLVSYVIPLAALQITGGEDDVINKSEDGTKTSTTTSSRAQILSDATDQFSSTAEEIIKKRFPDKTTITVDQGAVIKIIAAKDLVFPSAAIDNSHRMNNNN